MEYGIKNIKFQVSERTFKDREQTREFVSKVHKGFMLGQNMILQNLLILGEEKAKYKTRLKEANKERESKEIKDNIKESIEIVEYQEQIFRKLADSIAWQLLNQDITTIRRLYNHTAQIEVFNSNIKHDLEVVNELFSEDNEIFPLISDITSFIQVGDLLIKDKKSLKIVELKEGKVNEEISELLGDHAEHKCDRRLLFQLEEKDEKFRKQFKRYVKQQATASNTVKIVNSGEGVDNQGNHVKIFEDIFYTKHFDEKVCDMLEVINKQAYSINYIEDCLALMVYRGEYSSLGMGFESWKKSLGIEFPTSDIKFFLRNPVNYPLFLHPFSLEDKVKIITSEKNILMSLNMDNWLSMFKKKGAKVRLLSKKETARLNTKSKELKVFEYNGQAIEIENDGCKQLIADGIFERMFNQLQLPSSLVDYLIHSNKAGSDYFD